MIHFDPESNFMQDLADVWNKKLKSVRISSFIAGFIMAALGVLCIIFKIESMTVLEIIVSAVIIALGVLKVVFYFRFPIPFRSAGLLADGVLDVIIGILLVSAPVSISVTAYAFMFALVLMVFGIEEVGLGHRLGFFTMGNYGWIIAGGFINIAAALALLFAPLYSGFVINYVLAFYLCAGGINLIIDGFAMGEMTVKSPNTYRIVQGS